ANKFLERMYEVAVGGRKLEAPTAEALLEDGVVVRPKASARKKVTPADEFMRRIFDDFLGLADNGSVAAVLKHVRAGRLVELLKRKHAGKAVDRGDLVEALADAKEKLDRRAEVVFQEKMSPLVFYVGATGLLPDGVGARALTADELAKKYPALTFSK